MSQPTPRATFADIPPEILLERLLPVLSVRDLLSLSQTDQRLHSICNDESHWLHRTRQTFSFNPHTLAPSTPGSGWSKRLYVGLSQPEPFVWGSTENDRLGLPAQVRPGGGRTMSYAARVLRPHSLAGQFGGSGRRWIERLTLDLQGRGVEDKRDLAIVEMQAGGWSFAARDVEGKVWVWGQLDGDLPAFRIASWADKYERVPEPTPIPLPCRAEAISVGRCHMLILDEDNLIWEMKAWGLAYHHTAPALTSPSNSGSTRRPHHILQLSTGWSHSACLTSSGGIFVWFPFTQGYDANLTPKAQMNGPLGVRADGNASRAVMWGAVGDIVHELEALPERPTYEDEDAEMKAKQDEWADWDSRSDKAKEDGERVVKIASGQGFVVALKGNGEVWYRQVEENVHFNWEYLPHFSSPQITHISAQFTSLTSYSTLPPSRVHHARLPNYSLTGASAQFRPDPLPSLQGQGVIQVAIGDYHYAALTSRGEMWTWGQGAAGQLGLGQKGSRGGDKVDEPQMVGEGEKAFVFSIAAAGHHTGALVLGRKKRSDEEEEAVQVKVTSESTGDGITRGEHDGPTANMPGAFPTTRPQSLNRPSGPSGNSSTPAPTSRPGEQLALGLSHFRIGFAGRNALPLPLEPQAGDGELEVPLAEGSGGGDRGSRRNWVRTNRGGTGGTAEPARQGDEI
ncbi:regulator of chromosome condensation 1/beta-lactamase-inhibitor protein II [Dioszegia hungarica]|uniref:Regulator of chromosome condensation 1/beta-lactamase-inhibitor protein II n=1 Tax=Dioszegia hungarica TaxID=4972 RepID=A0AA38HD39_9TREE|nr:regulator of chromosome condensation 1/beta-lactamase-inhibitor protein II [Dioszegia hungarica]KAI9637852.1 regulator of chromosome condensation 1/beta-lactamase-inhibitor protein II [Dioszegia hungarica]